MVATEWHKICPQNICVNIEDLITSVHASLCDCAFMSNLLLTIYSIITSFCQPELKYSGNRLILIQSIVVKRSWIIKVSINLRRRPRK